MPEVARHANPVDTANGATGGLSATRPKDGDTRVPSFSYATMPLAYARKSCRPRLGKTIAAYRAACSCSPTYADKGRREAAGDGPLFVPLGLWVADEFRE